MQQKKITFYLFLDLFIQLQPKLKQETAFHSSVVKLLNRPEPKQKFIRVCKVSSVSTSELLTWPK